jgi:hypothetical protein
LAGKFSPDQLIQAGIAKRHPLELLPSDALKCPGSPLVFLRPEPNEEPVEVLTSSGALSGCRLPLIASLSERRTLDALDTHLGDLLLASSIEDMVVLRTLGLPASLACGLDTVDGASLHGTVPSRE